MYDHNNEPKAYHIKILTKSEEFIMSKNLLYLLSFFKTYKMQSAFIIAVLFVELIFESFLPLSFKLIVDYAILPKDKNLLILILVTIVGFAILSTVLGILKERVFSTLAASIIKDIYELLFHQLHKLSMKFFSKTKSADILALFNIHLKSVENFVILIPYTLISILGLVTNLVILFFLQWQLTLIAMIGLPLCLVGPKLFGKRAFAANDALKERTTSIVENVQENMQAQPILKAFNLPSFMITRFASLSTDYQQAAKKSHFLNFLMERTTNMGTLILNLITICLGSWLAYNGSLSIGSLLAFSSILLSISTLVVAITWLIPQIIDASVGLDNMQQFFNEKPDVKDEGTKTLTAFQNNITFDQVSFSYDDNHLNLNEISLTIPKGYYCAFVGPSGSGKSTIINLVMRYYEPKSGTITFDDMHLQDITNESLRQQIAIVSQDNFLFNTTIYENIRLGNLEATDEQIIQAAKLAEIHDVIMAMPEGYNTIVGERGGKLSGGQRQRIAIARALVRDPSILVLDEATSALDPATEEAINQTINKIAKTKTILSVTHRLSSIRNVDRIFVLDKGKLVEQGNHQELLQLPNGLYANLLDKQSGFSVSGDGLHSTVTAEKLKSIPILQNLHHELLEELAHLFVTEVYPQDRTIIQEGDEGDRFYILVRGKVEVRKNTEGNDTLLATLTDGDYFGEIALIHTVPRTATILSQTPVLLLSLQREQFQTLMKRAPDLLEELMKIR